MKQERSPLVSRIISPKMNPFSDHMTVSPSSRPLAETESQQDEDFLLNAADQIRRSGHYSAVILNPKGGEAHLSNEIDRHILLYNEPGGTVHISSKSRKTYKCHRCRKAFPSRAERYSHEDKYPFHCSQHKSHCFPSWYDHVRAERHHGNCPVGDCGRFCVDNEFFTEHYERRHDDLQ